MKTEPRECQLQFGSRKIPYRLYRTNRKTLRIVISPDLSVNAFAPLNVHDSRIHAVILKKAPRIARALDKADSYHPLPTVKFYVSGETFLYLGRQYRLKVVHGPTGLASLSGRFLRVALPDQTNSRSIKNIVKKWYRNRAREVFRRYFDKCYAIAGRHGIPCAELSVRSMQRRWGSCSASKRIILNSKLIQVPVHCVEYVIMHELCHLVRHDHSRRFYSLLTRCQPDWRKRKELLDKLTPA